MAEQTRPCVVSYRGAPHEAVFHRLGNEIYMDDGNHPHDKLVAVVEFKNGQMTTVEPHTVRFTDV